jgi:hypothetical protein
MHFIDMEILQADHDVHDGPSDPLVDSQNPHGDSH